MTDAKTIVNKIFKETGVLSPNEDEREEEFGSCSEHTEHTDKTAITSEADISSSDDGRDYRKTKGHTKSARRRKYASFSESDSDVCADDYTRSRSKVRRNARGTVQGKKGKSMRNAPSTSAPSNRRKEGTHSGCENDIECAKITGKAPKEKLSKEEVEEARRVMEETKKTVTELVGPGECSALGAMQESERRGRPAETGGYYLKQLEHARRELIATAREIKALREAIVPAHLSNNRKVAEKAAMEELQNAPASILPSHIYEAINGIDLVAEKSSKLKGEYRKRLNESAALIKAAVTHLVQRYEAPEVGLERDAELERLRERVSTQEREIVALRESATQSAHIQRELQELKLELEQLRSQRHNEEGRTTRATVGAKRQRTHIPSDTPSEADDPQVTTKMDCHQDSDEKVECRREEILAEIDREGLPAAIRPSVQGIRKVLDPEVPAAEVGPGMRTPARPESLEKRMAEMLVRCVEEKIGKMKEEIMRGIADKLPRTQAQLTKGKPSVTPALVVPAGGNRRDGSVGKGSAAKTKGKGQGREGKTPVPTSAAPRKAQPQVPRRRNETPVPTKAVLPVAQPHVLRREEAPRVPGSKDDTWTQVTKKKSKKRDNRPAPQGQPKEQQRSTQPNKRVNTAPSSSIRKSTAAGAKDGRDGGKKGMKDSGPNPPSQQAKSGKRRAPRTSAITLTCPPDTYAECMRVVRERITLRDFGITKVPHMRRTATGALSLELAGQGNAEKADALAAKMTDVLADKEGVRVGRPIMTADLRLSGFESSIAESEIREIIAKEGNTYPEGVKVGPIRQMSNGLCTVVVGCPLAAAIAIARNSRVALGWSSTKVEMLSKRPLQCYRCLEQGHTRATCTSAVDRTDVCYRCGEAGHPAKSCAAPARCAICADKGLPCDHRVGGPACRGSLKKKRRAGGSKSSKPDASRAVAAEEERKKKEKKPVKQESLVVTGFTVTHEGVRVAGTPAGTEAVKESPKPQRQTRARSALAAETEAVEIMEVDLTSPVLSKDEQALILVEQTREEAPMITEPEEESGLAIPLNEEEVRPEDSVGYM